MSWKLENDEFAYHIAGINYLAWKYIDNHCEFANLNTRKWMLCLLITIFYYRVRRRVGQIWCISNIFLTDDINSHLNICKNFFYLQKPSLAEIDWKESTSLLLFCLWRFLECQCNFFFLPILIFFQKSRYGKYVILILLYDE